MLWGRLNGWQQSRTKTWTCAPLKHRWWWCTTALVVGINMWIKALLPPHWTPFTTPMTGLHCVMDFCKTTFFQIDHLLFIHWQRQSWPQSFCEQAKFNPLAPPSSQSLRGGAFNGTSIDVTQDFRDDTRQFPWMHSLWASCWWHYLSLSNIVSLPNSFGMVPVMRLIWKDSSSSFVSGASLQ